MLRKLAELYHNGVVLSQKYTLDSDLDEMKFDGNSKMAQLQKSHYYLYYY